MADYNFYIIPITKSGTTYTPGTKINLEAYSVTGINAEIDYKSITGMEAYGKPRPYVETYAENDMADVEILSTDPRDQTDIVLTLYFMYKGDSSTAKNIQILDTSNLYHSFVSEIAGKYLLWYDTARQRKALLYQSDKIDPTTDSLKGLIYKEVQVKMKSIFGRSFPLSDTTIETALNIKDESGNVKNLTA